MTVELSLYNSPHGFTSFTLGSNGTTFTLPDLKHLAEDLDRNEMKGIIAACANASSLRCSFQQYEVFSSVLAGTRTSYYFQYFSTWCINSLRKIDISFSYYGDGTTREALQAIASTCPLLQELIIASSCGTILMDVASMLPTCLELRAISTQHRDRCYYGGMNVVHDDLALLQGIAAILEAGKLQNYTLQELTIVGTATPHNFAGI